MERVSPRTPGMRKIIKVDLTSPHNEQEPVLTGDQNRDCVGEYFNLHTALSCKICSSTLSCHIPIEGVSKMLSFRERVLRFLSRREPQGDPFILMLPDDIHREIASFLTPISKASLALACTRFHEIHHRALSSRDLQFPHSFQIRFRYRRREDSFGSLRWQFLGYLENERWLRCSRCLKLHPPLEFPQTSLTRVPEKRVCAQGKKAGIVDLCPCIRLTYRDKQRLIEHFQLDPKRPKYLGEVDLSPGSPHLWHQCKIRGSRTYTTKIFPVLEGGDLKFVTTYDIRNGASESGTWAPMGPVRLCCPHLSASTYWGNAREAVSQNHSRYVLHDCNNRVGCRWCATTIGNFDESQDNIHFKTIRNLGPGGPLPDSTWFNQTVYSQDPPQDMKHLDQYPFWKVIRFRPDLIGRRDLTVKKLGGLC